MPSRGSKLPTISFSSVDLPAPFGPTRAMRESRSTPKSTCSNILIRHSAALLTQQGLMSLLSGRCESCAAHHMVFCHQCSCRGLWESSLNARDFSTFILKEHPSLCRPLQAGLKAWHICGYDDTGVAGLPESSCSQRISGHGSCIVLPGPSRLLHECAQQLADPGKFLIKTPARYPSCSRAMDGDRQIIVHWALAG